jgi:hypothetical protein
MSQRLCSGRGSDTCDPRTDGSFHGAVEKSMANPVNNTFLPIGKFVTPRLHDVLLILWPIHASQDSQETNISRLVDGGAQAQRHTHIPISVSSFLTHQAGMPREGGCSF